MLRRDYSNNQTINDFMKDEKKNNVPECEKGTMIEIVSRCCSDKIQTNVQPGRRYVVKKQLQLKSGVKAIEVINPDAKKKTIRINAERFTWRIVDLEEKKKLYERNVAQMDNHIKKEMLKQRFTDMEMDHILFTPYIYELLAWHYLNICQSYAVEHRLDYRKESRMEKAAFEKTLKDMSFELGPKVIRGFMEGVEKMTEEMDAEFTRIWWMINNEIKRVDAEADDITLKTYALFGILIVRVLDDHEHDSDNLINSRLCGMMKYEHRGKRSQVLMALLTMYAREAVKVDYSRLRMCEKVISTWVEACRFNTLHKEYIKA